MSLRAKRILCLPEKKQQELSLILEKLLAYDKAKIHFIILFGSYARGDFVEDTYVEDGITYSYQSDFDLLVITDNCPMRAQQKIERELSKIIRDDHHIFTPASLIVHDITTINQYLSQRQYFFSDIKREGIQLYDSHEQKLARLKPLSAHDRYTCAVEDFKYWFKSASGFYQQFEFAITKKDFKIAAFLLHQTTERLYHAIILVYTHYKPKTHDLEELRKLANSLDNRLIKVFPLSSENDKRLFELLRRAYIDSRYKKGYRITKSELTQLQQKVMALQKITKKICQEKIKLFKAALGVSKGSEID